MPRSSQFWDRHAAGYARRPVEDETAYQEKLAKTQGYLKPDMDVLELGCGTGTTSINHAPFVRHIRAIDISANMLAIARDKAAAAHVTNVTFEQSNIEDLKTTDASYDVVMGHSILHLLEDREAVIAKVYKMLKPGGIFVTSTSCLGGRLPLLKVILPIGRYFGLLPLVNFFTVEEHMEDLTGAGYRIDYQWQPGKTKAVFIIAAKG
ncbi:MAG: class I SAM-dependent methyltransferase [Rhodospirillales bacterium]|nr:class I SAM-dependent methyltransferase [Rhodospirillales bacterium]